MKRAVRFVLSVCLLIQISDQTADRGLRIRAKLFEHEPRPHKLTTGRSNNAGLRLEPAKQYQKMPPLLFSNGGIFWCR